MVGVDTKRVKQLLGLPRRAEITMAISMGKRAEGGIYNGRFRFPQEDFIHEH